MYGHNKENEAKITYDQRKGLNEINVTDYKIIIIEWFLKNIEHIFTKYKTDFNNIKSRLEAYNFNFESDTGGQLGTDEYKENGDKTNIQKLDEKLQEFNRQNTNRSNLRAEFEITSPSTIDIYLKNENGSFKELVAHNVKVNITPSAVYNSRIATRNLEQRLIIKLGKWVDFQNGTTKLVDDKLVRYPSDKRRKLKQEPKDMAENELHIRH
nr:hypothetical protein [Mycoplasmopsis bovis]